MRIERDIVQELGPDSFKDEYGQTGSTWLQGLQEVDFDPSAKESTNKERTKLKEAGALTAELQNLVNMGTRLTQSYLDGIEVVKRVKQENNEEYSEPTPDK